MSSISTWVTERRHESTLPELLGHQHPDQKDAYEQKLQAYACEAYRIDGGKKPEGCPDLDGGKSLWDLFKDKEEELEDLIEARKKLIAQRANEYEFQMLYGVRGPLQRQLLEDGYPVRIYVPYGVAWYPYLTRRLAEMEVIPLSKGAGAFLESIGIYAFFIVIAGFGVWVIGTFIKNISVLKGEEVM